ncbi:MAG: hypothetical protein ABI625_10695 [bacterium]
MTHRTYGPMLGVFMAFVALGACAKGDDGDKEVAGKDTTAVAASAAKAPASPWKLDMHDAGSEAKLETSAERPELLKIMIKKAAGPKTWDIQLRKPGITLVAGDSLNLTLKARADGIRELSYGLNMAHTPWTGLGFYRKVPITSEWKTLTNTFVLKQGDPNSQLVFDLGGSGVQVELDSIVLKHVPSGEVIKP